MEATGSLIFSTVTSIQPMLGWVVLVWRFFTYYIYILSGIGINIFEVIRDAVRRKRAGCAEIPDAQPPEDPPETE